MHKREPLVVGSWHAQFVNQAIAAMKAREAGDIDNAEILEKSAKVTEEKIEAYELNCCIAPTS